MSASSGPTNSSKGIALAAFGALILTPDALFMRLSGMDGWQMMAWRGLCTGAMFWGIWLVLRRPGGGVRGLARPAAAVLVLAHFMNALLFPLGISSAPVAVVLLAVATMPVCAALMSRLVLGEPTSVRTWAAIAAVLTGIVIAVSEGHALSLDPAALLGAACGLGVALCLATTFVTLRRAPDLPLLPALGSGSALAGLVGLAITGPAQMTDGNVPSILLTGLVILPASFFALSSASRMTQAANVGLLMLLETVLGPSWVWLGLDEAPTERMLIGAAIVVGSLALYIAAPRRRALPA